MILLSVCLPTSFLSLQVHAQTPHVYISEIAWAGSSLSNADEWVELFNSSQEPINLSGWVLEGAASSQGSLVLPENSLIEPGQTFLIANYKEGEEKSTLSVSPSYVTSDISLSNSSLYLALKNAQGEMQDEAGDGAAPFAGSSEETQKRTMVRKEMNSNGSMAESWFSANISVGFDPGTLDLGTPGFLETFSEQTLEQEPETVLEQQEIITDETEQIAETSVQEQTESSESIPPAENQEALPNQEKIIFINELVSDPAEGQKEWVEFFNPNQETFDLQGWTVTEAGGKSYSFVETFVESFSYVVLEIPSSALNNSGDTISLFDPQGTLVDQVVYGTEKIPAVSDPNALARTKEGTFQETSLPTPKQENLFTSTQSSEQTTSEESKPGDEEATSQTEQITSEQTQPSTLEQTNAPNTQTEEIAENKTLLINELVSDPAEGQKEWVEIYNPNQETISLDGWALSEASGKIYPFLEKEIKPQMYVVQEISSSSLNNAGDTVSLFDPQGIIVDQVIYGTEQIPAPADTYALARTQQEIFIETTTPTPGQENIFSSSSSESSEQVVADVSTQETENTNSESDSDTQQETSSQETSDSISSNSSATQQTLSYVSGTLLINEFVSDPINGAGEWIEIYNPGSSSVQTKDWILTEGSGKKFTLPEGSIETKKYLVVNLSSSSLNNEGDTITLLDPSANMIDQITYGTADVPATSDPNSLARKENGAFVTTTTTTPGTQNIFTADTSSSTSSTTTSQNSSSSTSSSSSSSSSTNNSQTASSYTVGTLVINEFVSDPVSGQKEWVEIYNPGNLSVPLKGWILQDKSKKTFVFSQTKILSKSYIILELSSGTLNNDSDQITLFDPAGNSIDQIVYGTEAIPTTQDPNAVARKTNGAFEVTTLPTPGKENKFEHPEEEEEEEENKQTNEHTETQTTGTAQEQTNASLQSPDTLSFSEIYPNTIGSDEDQEFVEIFNHGTQTVQTAGWTVKDASGKTWNLQNLSLIPGQYFALERTITNITLNNVGKETLFLYNSQKILVDELSYANAPKGASYADFPNGWHWTAAITRNQPNTFQEPLLQTSASVSQQGTTATPILNTKIAKLRELNIGTRVRVRGIVAAAPGVLGNQIMYLAGSGIQVFQSQGEFPELSVGDEVEVVGTLSSNRGETRIKMERLQDMTRIGFGTIPSVYAVSSLSETWEGHLVQVRGQIVKRSKDRLTLETQEGQVIVRIKPNTELSFSEMILGATLQTTGIVGQVDEDYFLFVRTEEDIVVESVPEQEATPVIASGKDVQQTINKQKALWVLAGGLFLFAIFFARSFYQKQKSYGKKPISLSPARGI